MAVLSASLATAHRWLHRLLPRAPGKVPGRHVGECAGARVQSGSLSRQAPCRGRCLVASESLSLAGLCDAFLASSSCRASGSSSLAGPCWDARRVAASSLKCLDWPSRQASLAGALSPELKYFVLGWLQGNLGGSWRSPGKPLPRGAATARAQVRDTRVPLL